MIDKTLMVYVILVSVCALGYIIYWLYNSNAKKKRIAKIFFNYYNNAFDGLWMYAYIETLFSRFI